MYNPTPIDRNIIKQQWFNDMKPEHAELLKWLWLDEMDSIGVVEPDFDGFEKFTKGIVTRSDIDLQEFVDDCNNDRKVRMIFVDRGRKLCFLPTIFFKNSVNGFRRMIPNQRDAAIIRKLADRQETRTWFIEQVIYNDKLEVPKGLIEMVHNWPKATKVQKEYTRTIANKLGFKISKGKNSSDDIKERYGCHCQYCGEVFTKEQLEIDHVVPRSSRQKQVEFIWNKVPACTECNEDKGNENVFEFIKRRGFELHTGVKIAADKWVKKGILGYPTQLGDKRNIKEKFFTYDQVKKIHFNERDTRVQQDFEITDKKRNGKKLWKQK